MRIDGITTCCGDEYAGYLARALPAWLETLDSVTVITRHADEFHRLCWPAPLCVVTTNSFGTKFNKGAALNEGIDGLREPDWILSFDCDVIPPTDWRKKTEPQLRCGCLHGARRHSASGTPVDRYWYPRGYFQLWHASSRVRFPVTYEDAGGYDTEFADYWPARDWVDVGISLLHLGKKARHWCGPNASRRENAEAVNRAIERQKARR